MSDNQKVFCHFLGLIDYKEAWDFQETIFKSSIDLKIARRNGETEELPEHHLLFCQHPHVYTLGKSGKEAHLLLDESQLDAKEAKFYKINRGGDITYHGPGQLVVYPIFDLDQFFTDIHKYLRFLEEAIILTLAEYGISANRIEGLTGVWLDGDTTLARKICAFGVKSSRWVTMHGIGFNVNTDLSFFSNIIPCGIDDKAVTSMKKELGRELDLEEVADKLLVHLAELFDFKASRILNE
ncbi:MAG: lipoyl(octanoyl) transferase LipB [Flavobacteriia bacterium]|nr:lipoyl(octanoyl) transferase LipB [Flavobacteriia bacterium]